MKITDLISDLELLYAEQLSCSFFRDKYLSRKDPEASDSDVWKSLPDIVHGLGHYICDEDLRKKDPEYGKMQKSELEKLIRLLKAGASENVLQKISFLGPSEISLQAKDVQKKS